MSTFDVGANITIGQYLPLDSTLHRLDPRAKIILFLLLTAASTAAQNWIGLCLGLLVGFGLLALGRIPPRHALKNLLPPLPFLLILAAIQVFFNIQGGSPLILLTVGPVHITQGGLVAGGMLLLRFSVLILTLSLASFCISISELIHGLEALLKPLSTLRIPVQDLITIIQLVVRFIPLLALSASQIAKAQASRGASWGNKKGNLLQRARQIIPIIVPLFISALRSAENLALAMDARGYGSNSQRTSMIEYQIQWKDGVVITAAIAAATLIVIL
jgi:energy-coupling factor transport system permease protein